MNHAPFRGINPVLPGHGTIDSQHLAPPICFDETLRSYASNPFFDESHGMIVRGDARIAYDAQQHGVLFQSFPKRRAPQGGLLRTNRVMMVIGGYERRLRLCVPFRVIHLRANVTGDISTEQLKAVMPEGLPNDRAAGAALNPWLANVTMARALSLYVAINTQRYDNTLLYTKGAFYSLLAGRVEQEHLACIYPQFPAANPISTIDITAAGVTPEMIGDLIQQGNFVLFQGVDYDPNDILYIKYLALPGRRIAPAGAISLAAMTVTWPEIRFTILSRGPPNVPATQPGPINSEGMWRFLQRFALTRRERDYFAAGCYEASFLVNGKLEICHNGELPPQDAANRADTQDDGQLYDITGVDDLPEGTAGYEWHTFVSPTLETFGELVLPQPREYNFLHRLLQLTRSEDRKFLKDYICFGGSSVLERLLHSAVLAGFTSIFFTTALQSFSVNGTVIQLAAMRSNLTPPLYYELTQELGLTVNVSGDVNDSPSLFVLVVNAIDRHIGGVLPLTTLATRSWNSPVLTWGFEGPFGLTSPHHPPRFGNPMSIMAWLDTFPVEWGLVDYHAKADMRQEVVIQGTPMVRGWYASGGSAAYRDVMKSTSPYSLKPYGALAMNIISQALTNFLAAGQPPFSYQTFAWDRTGLTPNLIVPANPNPPTWMGFHRVFEPCTVQAFDWLSRTTYAPMLQEVAAGAQVTEAIGTTQLDNVILFFGFAMALKVTNPAPPTTPVPLPGLKRRMGVNFGPGPSTGEPTPPPAKVALSEPPKPLQPVNNPGPSPN